jgi:putative chitinase
MAIIPAGVIKKLCPSLNSTRAGIIENYLNKICPQYGISTGDIMHEFLANLLHECQCFTSYEESLNYSSEALIKNFSRARISEADAYRYGRNDKHSADQKNIGNTIYGGEWGRIHLGNTQPDDGFNLRGSGPIQLTGRDMFQRFALYMKMKFGIDKNVYEWADTLRSSDQFGIHSACWFFAIAKNLISLAVSDEMKKIVIRINGGLNGYPERLKYYELCKQLIPEA